MSTTELEKVFDPDSESEGFCLDCVKKHSGLSFILINEAMDRIRQDPNHQDKDTVAFIRLHADKSFNELTAIEDHIKNAKVTDSRIKKEFDDLAHEVRVTRDKIRTYLKSAPNPKANNWDEMSKKVIAGENYPRIDLMVAAISSISKIQEKADILRSEIGCGECLANQDDLDKVKNLMNQYLSEKQTENVIKPEIEKNILTDDKSLYESISSTKTPKSVSTITETTSYLSNKTVDETIDDFKKKKGIFANILSEFENEKNFFNPAYKELKVAFNNFDLREPVREFIKEAVKTPAMIFNDLIYVFLPYSKSKQ